VRTLIATLSESSLTEGASASSSLALAAAAGAVSATAGYLYGRTTTTENINDNKSSDAPGDAKDDATIISLQDDEENSEDEEAADGDLGTVTAGLLQPCKMV
jgi:hypothetical protein